MKIEKSHFIKNKKSAIWTLVGLIALVVVIIIVINIIKSKFLDTKEESTRLQAGAGDYDGDGIVNYYDECACNAGIEKDPHNGCPAADQYKDGYGDRRKANCENCISKNEGCELLLEPI